MIAIVHVHACTVRNAAQRWHCVLALAAVVDGGQRDCVSVMLVPGAAAPDKVKATSQWLSRPESKFSAYLPTVPPLLSVPDGFFQ